MARSFDLLLAMMYNNLARLVQRYRDLARALCGWRQGEFTAAFLDTFFATGLVTQAGCLAAFCPPGFAVFFFGCHLLRRGLGLRNQGRNKNGDLVSAFLGAAVFAFVATFFGGTFLHDGLGQAGRLPCLFFPAEFLRWDF